MIPQRALLARFHVEHIRAVSHGGSDDDENLCLACPRCNRLKGPNPSGYDPETDALTRLFNPRDDSWASHFVWDGVRIVGVTDIGRATVSLLRLNGEDRLMVRRALSEQNELNSD